MSERKDRSEGISQVSKIRIFRTEKLIIIP